MMILDVPNLVPHVLNGAVDKGVCLGFGETFLEFRHRLVEDRIGISVCLILASRWGHLGRRCIHYEPS